MPREMIAVTGACGFVGNHLIDRLIETGRKSRAIDLIYGPHHDIRDACAMGRLMRDIGPTHVVHLAALAGVGLGDRHWPDYYDTNVKGTANVLQGAYDAGCRNAVVFSSASVYGLRDVKGDGHDPINPRGHYGASKAAMEGVCAMFRAKGMKVTVLRPFTIYGDFPRPDGVFGLWKEGRGKANINSYRGFTHVDDVLDAVDLFLKRGDPKEDVLPIDVSGPKVCIGDLKVSSNRLVEIDRSVVDTSSSKCRLLRSYGWKPTRSVKKWWNEQK